MTHLQKEKFLKNGFIYENSEYDDSPYIISKKLIEDGRQNLLLNNEINISIPTILIHGQKDNDVPWETAIELSSKINTDDIKTIIVKDGSHRLSRKKDLDLISKCLDELYFKILH
jgi:dipeptidyl aminopeptidase/acylaminoacyl peptidase